MAIRCIDFGFALDARTRCQLQHAISRWEQCSPKKQARAIFAQGQDAVVPALLEQAKMLADQKSAGRCRNIEPDSRYAVWNAAGLPEAEYVVAPPKEKAGPRERASGEPSPSARTIDRMSSTVPTFPGLRRHIVAMRGNPHTLYRRHPRHPAGSDGAHDPSRLVPGARKGRARVADALPKSTLGNRVLVLSAWLHYALGNTLSQIVEVFNFHLQMKLTRRVGADVVSAASNSLSWYEQIQREAFVRPCCMPTKAAGGWMARPTGCGASPRGRPFT